MLSEQFSNALQRVFGDNIPYIEEKTYPLFNNFELLASKDFNLEVYYCLLNKCRWYNGVYIVRRLDANGSMLANELGITRQTVANYLAYLKKVGLVIEDRESKYLFINPKSTNRYIT